MNAALIALRKHYFWIPVLLFIVAMVLSMYFQESFFMALPFAALLIPLGFLDIRYIFFVLVFSIPLSIESNFNIDFPDELLMLYLTILTLFFVVLRGDKLSTIGFTKHPIFILLFLTFLWTLVACICSQDAAMSFKFLLKKVWYILPFFILPIFVFTKQHYVIRTAQLILLPLAVITVLSIIKHSAVDFRFDMLHDPIQPFFVNHVLYGSMVSAAIPLAIGTLWLSRRLSIQWFLAILFVIIFLVATYFSYSRAAWVSVLFALTIYFAIRFKVVTFLMIFFYIAILSGIFYLAQDNNFLKYKPVYDKTVMHETLQEHIMATLQGTDISSAERYYRWIAAVKMSADYPITGVGPNNFYDYYKPYVVKSFRTWVSRNPERSTTHNYFLFLLVEQGYPAMLLYGLLYLSIFYYGQKYYHRAKNRTDKIILMTTLGILATIFINNFFSELIETDKIGSLFYIGLAVIVSFGIKQQNHSKAGIA